MSRRLILITLLPPKNSRNKHPQEESTLASGASTIRDCACNIGISHRQAPLGFFAQSKPMRRGVKKARPPTDEHTGLSLSPCPGPLGCHSFALLKDLSSLSLMTAAIASFSEDSEPRLSPHWSCLTEARPKGVLALIMIYFQHVLSCLGTVHKLVSVPSLHHHVARHQFYHLCVVATSSRCEGPVCDGRRC